MRRRVKEILDIGDHESLDELIQKLCEVRDSLPPESEAQLQLRGDEVFGRRITGLAAVHARQPLQIPAAADMPEPVVLKVDGRQFAQNGELR